MPNQRVHIATWIDSAGHATATTLQSNQLAATVAYDDTPNNAIRQIKDYLRWLAKRDEWYAETDLEDVELRKLRLSVRPRHHHEHQDLLLPTQVELRLPCVTGRLGRHSWLGTVPTIGLSYVVHSNIDMQRIAEEQVRAYLANKTTAELIAFMGVREVELCEISIPRPAPEFKVHATTRSPALEAVAHPLGKQLRRAKLEPIFQRDASVRELTQRLTQSSSPIVLLGDEGVGKSSVLGHAARGVVKYQREQEGPTPPHRIWATSAGRLIAGMRYLGQWEERCEEVIDELNSISGWLCIDNLHDLILTGGKDPRSSLAAFFLPYLQHGQLRMVCEATPQQLVAAERLLPEFVEVLTRLPLDRLKPNACSIAIDQASHVTAEQHRVSFATGVASCVLRLVGRFEPYKAPLAPSIQVLRRLAAQARKQKYAEVSVDDVYQTYAEKTGLPLDILLEQVRLTYDEVVARLKREVVGQQAACKRVATVVTTFKAGLNAENRPLGVLLFCGPTGVGKTQLAKTLGDYLFGHSRDNTLVRLDMSEYRGPTAADRLMCKPDRSPSSWIQRVRKQPFCVLLLDEIEKADPQVFDVVMGLMDEGRLTDIYGRVTDFTSSIVIMTSNLGVTATQDIGFGETNANRFEARVRGFFRPEFFNRIDAVIPFAKLSEADCLQILDIEFNALQARDGLARRGVKLEFDRSVIDLLMRTGFDEALGARPLQRSLEQNITSRIARFLAKHYRLRDCTLRLRTNEAKEITIE